MNARQAAQLKLWIESHCFKTALVKRTGRCCEYFAIIVCIPYHAANGDADGQEWGADWHYVLNYRGARNVLGY